MARLMAVRAAVLLAVSIATGVSATGVARKPPLGFNTWNQFACNGINAGAHRQPTHAAHLLICSFTGVGAWRSCHEADRGPDGLDRSSWSRL
jgi:hypothetical protein